MPKKLPPLPDFDMLPAIQDEAIRLTLEKLIKYVEEYKNQVEKDL